MNRVEKILIKLYPDYYILKRFWKWMKKNKYGYLDDYGIRITLVNFDSPGNKTMLIGYLHEYIMHLGYTFIHPQICEIDELYNAYVKRIECIEKELDLN